MKRRAFIAAAAGAAVWPLAAQAQDGRLRRIGVLALGGENQHSFMTTFKAALLARGYVEGRTVAFEVRAARTTDALAEGAADLVTLKVDVIAALLTPCAAAAKKATRTIPVVMAGVGDPLGTGLVDSLAHPGGNVTGTTTAAAEVAGKTVELMREALPATRTVGVLANETDPFTKPFLAETQRAAASLGVGLHPVLLRPGEPFASAFEEFHRAPVDAVILQGSLLRKEAADLAIKYRLPAFSTNRSGPDAGGLMAYSANSKETFEATADYVDRILKGMKPADLPVEVTRKFDLVINTKTAKALGLTLPESLLVRADEIIE